MATNRHKYQFDLEGIIRGYALYHVLRKSSISFHRAYLKAQPFRAESRFLGSYQYPQGFPKCGGLHRFARSKCGFLIIESRPPRHLDLSVEASILRASISEAAWQI